MMGWTVKLIIAMVLTVVFEWFLPWWGIAMGAFAVGFITEKGSFQAFMAGFAGVGLVWLLYAGWLGMQNDFLLAEKIAELFQLPSSVLILAITVVVGGLVGGVSALSGFWIKLLLTAKGET